VFASYSTDELMDYYHIFLIFIVCVCIYIYIYLFIYVQSSKSSVYMYNYEPEGTDALNDIKRLQSYGKYRMVTEYTHADTHRVSALACMNSVQSVLCLSATADK
jgi:hypothetical protein